MLLVCLAVVPAVRAVPAVRSVALSDTPAVVQHPLPTPAAAIISGPSLSSSASSTPLPQLGPAPRSAAEAAALVASGVLARTQTSASPNVACPAAPLEASQAANLCDDLCRGARQNEYHLNFGVKAVVDTRGLGSGQSLGPGGRAPSGPFLQAFEEGSSGLCALKAIQALRRLNSSALFLVDIGPRTFQEAPPTQDPTFSLGEATAPRALLEVLAASGVDAQSSLLPGALHSPAALVAAILAPRLASSDGLAPWGPLLQSSAIVLEPGNALPLGGGPGSVEELRALVCALAPGWSVDVFRGAVHIYPPLRTYTVPPMRIPPFLWDEYSAGGKMAMGNEYYNEAVEPGGAPRHVTYTAAKINDWMGKAGRREENYYGALDSCIYRLLDRHKEAVAGKRVAIMGSLEPWYEIVALTYGAASVFTVEYGPRSSEDPRFSFITPSTMMQAIAAGTWEPFDVAFSVSSFEHDGLGRYGDPLAGDGDLRAMREVRDFVVKPGGHLLFSVPVGGDCVAFNAHRVYGRHRLPMMLEGWAKVDTECLNEEVSFAQWPCASWMQPAILLQKPMI